MLLSAGKVKSEDIDIFLKGAGALDINSVRKKPKVRTACCTRVAAQSRASDCQQCAATILRPVLHIDEHCSLGHCFQQKSARPDLSPCSCRRSGCLTQSG